MAKYKYFFDNNYAYQIVEKENGDILVRKYNDKQEDQSLIWELSLKALWEEAQVSDLANAEYIRLKQLIRKDKE